MTRSRFALALAAMLPLALPGTACRGPSSRALRAPSQTIDPRSITVLDPSDTAAYAEAGPAALAAVAQCHRPACRPAIFRGPGKGELTVGLDSAAKPGSEHQWHIMPDSVPGGEAFQESSWRAMVDKWRTAKPQRLLLVDGTPRTYEYVRDHVTLSSIWGFQELSAEQAKAVSSDSSAAFGAIAITTKAHASRPPSDRRR